MAVQDLAVAIDGWAMFSSRWVCDVDNGCTTDVEEAQRLDVFDSED